MKKHDKNQFDHDDLLKVKNNLEHTDFDVSKDHKSHHDDSDFNFIKGTNHDDLIYGTDNNDFIKAGKGDDIIFANNGNDFIKAGKGDDYIDPGSGNDKVDAGKGDDILVYHLDTNSTDFYDGGKGIDTLRFDLTLNDFKLIQNDLVEFKTFLDNQEVYHENSHNLFTFDNFNLTVKNIENVEVVVDGKVVNDITTPPVDLNLFTLNSDVVDFNTLVNDAQIQAIVTSGNESTLLHNALDGNDVVHLANDQNTADLLGYNTSVTFDSGLGDDMVIGGMSQWNNITQTRNIAANDIINGNDGNDKIWGGDGNDIILGGNGDDQLFAGYDDNPNSTFSATLHSAGFGLDYIDGGAGNDYIVGSQGSDELHGGAGNDYINGGAVQPWQSSGNNFLYGEAGNDRVIGGNQTDYIDGGTGNDILNGNAGNDTILGGTGSDVIDGDNGNDVLTGGTDNDLVRGGFGNDTLVFNSGDSNPGIFTGGVYYQSTDTSGGDNFNGGYGNDILQLNLLSSVDWSAAFVQEVLDYQNQLNLNDTSYFEFNSIGLKVANVETIDLNVDGMNVDLDLLSQTNNIDDFSSFTV